MSETPTDIDTEDRSLDATEQRRAVRERYARIATESDDKESCCSDSGSCCSDDSLGSDSEKLGYSDAESDSVADGADLGLGCGNPNAIASLEAGETVLDLGSGAGFDCFLAAQEVGEAGQVIGVDMTPEMVEKARANAVKNRTPNVEFRLGEIEHLPVSDETVDVVISNCVINLSPEKQQVFDEAFRALTPGGRLAVSDVVQMAPFPDDVEADPDSLTGCVSGASTVDALETLLTAAGFESIEIAPKGDSAEFIAEWDADRDLSEYLVSATIEAEKPSV